MFVRSLSSDLMGQLANKELFKKKLWPDVKQGIVFPAVRKGKVDFYHKGGRLFSFSREFQTHIKYASVLDYKKDYVTENDLKDNVRMIRSFVDGYEAIKGNCVLYPGVEAVGVSSIYHNFSYVNSASEVVVLDVEVSFKSLDEETNQNRIDLLLFNKREKRLRFYEAKHFSNKEIWAATGKKPKVITGQISRYNRQICSDQDNIIGQYSRYLDIVAELFEVRLEKPISVDPTVGLLVFGYDKDQSDGRLKALLKKDGSLEGVKYYCKGNVSSLNILNMWKKS